MPKRASGAVPAPSSTLKEKLSLLVSTAVMVVSDQSSVDIGLGKGAAHRQGNTAAAKRSVGGGCGDRVDKLARRDCQRRS